MRAVAVFDTNILFSAVGGWKGPPYQCLQLARAGTVSLFTCAELLDELREKLQLKLDFSPTLAAVAIADLLSTVRVVQISGNLKVVAADPDDDKVIECAIVAQATHIVTGDKRHLLPLKNHQGIEIITAADFLALLKAP